jgi:uncharacterized protein (DUF58 family)
MKSRVRLNIFLLPILILLLVYLQLAHPSTVWKMLLVGLGGAWLVGYLWARALARSLSLTREMRYGWVQVGDRLEERFTVINNSLFPATWLEVNDHSNIPGYDPSRATNAGSKSVNQWFTEGVCTRRGLYTLGGTTILAGDPFGVYTVSIHDPTNTTLLVLPPVVPLPPIAISPGGAGEAGRPRTRAPEQSINAAGVREYQPGDSLRLIHWPTSARHEKPFVRLFDSAPASDAWILLDLDGAVQLGKDWDSTEEHGVILAASLIDRSLRARQGVGLAINGEEMIWLPPRHDANQRWATFHALALAHPGELKLGALLRRMGPSFGKRTSLVIITAAVQPDWLEALVPLTWQGIAPTVLLLDPQSFGGTQSASDAEGLMQRMGIACHVITRELLNRPEARPGRRGHPSGRHTPENMNNYWRGLA